MIIAENNLKRKEKFNMKSYQLVKKETEQRLGEAKSSLKALESIKYKSKKDGRPFEVLNKNFENAKVVIDYIGAINLHITGMQTLLVGFAKEGEEVTFETIKKLISEKMEGFKIAIDKTEEQLKQLPGVYDSLLDKFKKLAEEYNGFLYMLDAEDLLSARIYDYSDGREEKAKEEERQKRILEKIKEALKGKTGFREENILKNFSKVETLEFSKEAGKLYKVYAKDESFMLVKFPSRFSNDCSIVG